MDIDNDFLENDNILSLTIFQGIFVPILIYSIGKIINHCNK